MVFTIVRLLHYWCYSRYRERYKVGFISNISNISYFNNNNNNNNNNNKRNVTVFNCN